VVDIRDEGDARALVQAKLVTGERIVWVVRPDPSVNFTTADIVIIPFSVIWLGIVTSVWVAALTTSDEWSGSNVPFMVIPFLFSVIGLYYVFGRFIYKRWNKQRTVYAITDRRAIILAGPRSVRNTPASGQSIQTKISRNGSHETVTFGAPAPGIFSYNRTPPNTGLDFFTFMNRQPFAFYDVADVAGLDGALRASLEPNHDRIANA
jgi:hypothetical protein